MDHIDYDTEQVLFSAPESSSSDQLERAGGLTSVTHQTPRRLIRKPLPDLPPNQANRVGGQSLILGRTGSPRQHALTLEMSRERAKDAAIEQQKQLDWWPSTSKQQIDESEVVEEGRKRITGKLEEPYRQHLLRIIEESLEASGKPSEHLAKVIIEALEQCLETLATPEAMLALHRSYSLLWRVEALVRSNEQLDYSKAPKGGVRWPRLGAWRGSVSNGSNTEIRKKKRDVALQLLGNAFWMAGVGLEGPGLGIGIGIDEEHSKVSPGPSEKLPARRVPGAAPHLLVKSSTPTVALQMDSSNSSDEESKQKNVAEPSLDRSSVLTTRLAMQLKNAENSAAKTAPTPSPSRPKSIHDEEEVRMAVCKVCLDFVPVSSEEDEEDSAKAKTKQRRRSGTVTLSNSRREQNASTRSENTIRMPATSNNDVRILWNPDKFTGSPLFLNPLSSDAEGRDHLQDSKVYSQLQLIGGTFVVESNEDNEEEERMLQNVLDIGLYAACAMMLENALLCNFQLEPEWSEKPVDEQLDTPSTDAEQVEETQSSPSLTADSSDGQGEKVTRWSKGIWGIMQYGAIDQSNALKRGSPGAKKSKNPMEAMEEKGEKKFSGYSGRLGKMIHSLTSSTGRQATHAKVSDDVDRDEQHSQADAHDGKQDSKDKEEDKEETMNAKGDALKQAPPLSFSPHFSQTESNCSLDGDDKNKGDYLERLLSRHSLSLMVLEGLDVSLPFIKQQDQLLAASENKRVPLQSRTSFNEGESKGSGSTLSVSRSLASSSAKSIRTTSGTSNADSSASTPSKPATVSNLDEQSVDLDGKRRRDVQFYSKVGCSRDVSLGQAIEEMAAKAIVLHKEVKKPKEKEKEKEKEKGKETTETSNVKLDTPKTYRVAQYLHGHDRISIVASVAEKLTPSNPPTPTSEHVELHDEVKTSQMGQDIVRSAVLLAEQAEQKANKTGEGEDVKSKQDSILLWSANVKTGEATSMKIMSEATYLASYGTFLEAILSHPKFVVDKYDVVRMFKVGEVTLKFQIQSIVVFDLLVEGPVVMVERNGKANKQSITTTTTTTEADKVMQSTRLEIQSFYASVKEHISSLEHVFVARELDETGNTIKPSLLSSRSSISSAQSDDSSSVAESNQTEDTIEPSSGGPLRLLSKMKKSLRRAEFELYDLVKTTKVSSVNDVRKLFQNRAKSAKNRLSAWELKHLTKMELKELKPLQCCEPEYFEHGKHAFPGSRYLVREEEPLSIIAYTLSSKDFDEEMHRKDQKLNDVLNWRTSVVAPSTNSQFSSSNASTNTSTTASTSAATTTTAASSTNAVLDPDLDEEFHTPEPLQVNMKRKRRVKDAGILSLTLRRVNSNISSQSGSVIDKEWEEGTVPSRHDDQSQDLTSLHKGENSSFGGEDDVATPTASRIGPSKFDTLSTNNDTFRAQIAHVTPRGSLGSMFEGASTAPPTPSEERDSLSLSNASTTDTDGENTTTHSSSEKQTPTVDQQNTFKRRVVSQPVESTQAGPRLPVSPHIKQSIISGDVKISCISWFAEDFYKLRRKWNIETDFLHSMSRCKSWNMMGGKSKSGFFLTLDGKWIAKQLLNVWSVDEKEAFLEFAPAYLRYMMNSTVNDCPTLLVKIAGVYTLKIKNVKTGETKLKMSVQVLENVFAGDLGESIRFDIKGIRERRVISKKDSSGSEEEERAPVWWDGEWLDCFQSRAYVPEVDKMIFRRALQNDLGFLTASNVMDYSLLIGAHESQPDGREERGEQPSTNKFKPTFRVRIVDFLGAWTLVKQLESSGKKAIKSQAPTIIPPNDYALRFGQAVESYFIPCPGR